MKKLNPIEVIQKSVTLKNYDNYIFFIDNSADLQNSICLRLAPFVSFMQDHIAQHNVKKGIIYLPLVIDNKYVYITICIGHVKCIADGYEDVKNVFGEVIAFMQKKKIANAVLFFGQGIEQKDYFKKMLESIQVAVGLKLYHFDEYITDQSKKKYNDINIAVVLDEPSAAQEGIQAGLTIASAINFSRYLSDIPAKELYPESFVQKVSEFLDTHGMAYKKRVIEGDELVTLGMGGIIGVGTGSVQKPRLLILEYMPDNLVSSEKKIALVGKGVTFDTGGISIKPSDGMEDMKADMSGAASVVSAFAALALLKSPHNIIAATPLAENMVDGGAIRPGDILRFYNGKTAEIKNTDAEGRLILADALSFLSDVYKPEVMIDLATLTGACRIALGPLYAGLMTENISLRNQIEQTGKLNGDNCWPLPLEDGYLPNMSSHVADMCNIGTKGYRAGATMGGMFLREFVNKDIAWAHIDIAPVATDCPTKKYIDSFGATGFGVYLLVDMFR